VTSLSRTPGRVNKNVFGGTKLSRGKNLLDKGKKKRKGSNKRRQENSLYVSGVRGGRGLHYN